MIQPQRTYRLRLPAEDRSFLATPASAVSSAALFSAVSDIQARAPHPVGQEWPEALVDDRPGAGARDPDLSARQDASWQHVWDQVTSTSGLSVPYASDLPNLMAQRQALVEAVVLGRADLVDAALGAGADPHALVPVRHPNAEAAQHTPYVALPLGVVAVMLGQRYTQAARDAGVQGRMDVQVQEAAYKRIAKTLLFDASDRPTVKVGMAPDGVGVAVSFYGWGISAHNHPLEGRLPTAESRALGPIALVRHNEPINQRLVNAIVDVSDELQADTRLKPQLAGDRLVGDALPAEHAMDLLAKGQRLEHNRGPVRRTLVSRADQVATDYATPHPLARRPR
jgi:hypothetical protein